jgi:zinc protease
MKRSWLISLTLALACACGHAQVSEQPKAAPAPAPAPAPPGTVVPPPAYTGKSAPVEEAPYPSTPAPKDHDIPDEGPARPFTPPKPQRIRLANGMDLVVVRRTNLPLVAFAMVWPSGAAEDPAQRAGTASLTANLLTEGAGARSALELATEVQRLGARLSAYASWDATTVSLVTLDRVLDSSLSLLADVVLRPRFEASDFERVRSEARTTLLQLNDQAGTQAQIAGGRAIYGDNHRYGGLVAGSAPGLAAVTRDEIVAWHRDRLGPQNATLVAVGNVDVAALRAKLEKLFPASGQGKRAPRPTTKETPAIRSDRTVVLVDRPGAAQTEMRAYTAGPIRATPDYFPLLVMNTIFGGNFSSWLNAKLREEKGYTYGARSDFSFRRNGGPFSAGAPVKTAVTRPALVDLLAQLERLEKGEVTDLEIRIAKQQLVRSMARYFETPPDIAQALATLVTYGLPDDYFATYAQKIERVSVADVTRVAKHWKASKMSLVFVGDEKVIGADVKEVLGNYQKVDVSPK